MARRPVTAPGGSRKRLRKSQTEPRLRSHSSWSTSCGTDASRPRRLGYSVSELILQNDIQEIRRQRRRRPKTAGILRERPISRASLRANRTIHRSMEALTSRRGSTSRTQEALTWRPLNNIMVKQFGELDSALFTARSGNLGNKPLVRPSTTKPRARKAKPKPKPAKKGMERSASAPSISQSFDPFRDGNPIQRVQAKLKFYRGNFDAQNELCAKVRGWKRKRRADVLGSGGNKVQMNKENAGRETFEMKLNRIRSFNKTQEAHARKFYNRRSFIREWHQQRQDLRLQICKATTRAERRRLKEQQHQLELSANMSPRDEMPPHSAVPGPSVDYERPYSRHALSRKMSMRRESGASSVLLSTPKRYNSRSEADSSSTIQQWWRHKLLTFRSQKAVIVRQLRTREKEIIRKMDNEHRQRMCREKPNAREDPTFNTSISKLPDDTVLEIVQLVLTQKRKGHYMKMRGYYRQVDAYHTQHEIPFRNMNVARKVLGVKRKCSKTFRKSLHITRPPPKKPLFKLLIQRKELDKLIKNALREMLLRHANIHSPTREHNANRKSMRRPSGPTRQNSLF